MLSTLRWSGEWEVPVTRNAKITPVNEGGGDPLPDVHRRSLAVEPMTCPPNAFRTGDALIRLEPGWMFGSGRVN
jgi:galactose mutarotase-like enzyme